MNKRHIGFVFQSYNLLDHMPVYENLHLPLSYQDLKKSERQAMVADVRIVKGEAARAEAS